MGRRRREIAGLWLPAVSLVEILASPLMPWWSLVGVCSTYYVLHIEAGSLTISKVSKLWPLLIYPAHCNPADSYQGFQSECGESKKSQVVNHQTAFSAMSPLSDRQLNSYHTESGLGLRPHATCLIWIDREVRGCGSGEELWQWFGKGKQSLVLFHCGSGLESS